MSRPFRLTPRADVSLDQIIDWTDEVFGPDQARRYVAELLERCRDIAKGTAHVRDCSVLSDDFDSGALRFAKAGQHYVVLRETSSEVQILDFVHGRRDLPGIVAALFLKQQ